MRPPCRQDHIPPTFPTLLLLVLATLVVPTGCLDAPEAPSVNGTTTWDPSDFPVIQEDGDAVDSGAALHLPPIANY